MTHKESVQLHGLLGALIGDREIAKCGLAAANDTLAQATTDWQVGYMQGMMKVYVKAIHQTQAVIRELDQILKGAR